MNDKLPDDAMVEYRLDHDLCIYCGRPLVPTLDPPTDEHTGLVTWSYCCDTRGCKMSQERLHERW